MSNWSLGPGLTSQIGPFKTHKDDLPKVRKFPWKGGGVPAGGQGHAGHGNYMQTMNPEIFPMGMKPHHSNNYKSIVTIFDINNVSKKSAPSRMKRQTILGRPDEQETSQKMSMGLVDRQHQVPFEQADKLEEEAEGIKPVQEESPQQVSNQQLMFGSGQLTDNDFTFGNDKYLTPPQSRRDSLVPQYSNNKESVVSMDMEYQPIEMKEYAHEYMEKDQYNLKPDLSERASDHRKLEYEMPRLLGKDIYSTGALGTQIPSETLAVEEGGALVPFKPQYIVTDAPTPARRRSSIAEMDTDESMSRRNSEIELIKPKFYHGKDKSFVVSEETRKQLRSKATKNILKKHVKNRYLKEVNAKIEKKNTLIKQASMEAKAVTRENKRKRGADDQSKPVKKPKTKQGKKALKHEDIPKEKAKKIAKSMVSLAVKNKVHKEAAERVAKTQTPSRRNSATKKALEEARVDAVYKHNKEKRKIAKTKYDKKNKSPSTSRRNSKSK